MIIKTCGLRIPDNITVISSMRVDWLGFIFYPKSSRYVGEDNEMLRTYLFENQLEQERVGVFVNTEQEDVISAVRDYSLTILQLHGDENPAYCQTLQKELVDKMGNKLPLMKAFSVGMDFNFEDVEAYHACCDYFLFDTKGATRGGTGHKFDWSILDQYKGDTPFLLSGGIGPEDVALVQAFQHPLWIGIDINSKFELAPAVKDNKKLAKFVQQITIGI